MFFWFGVGHSEFFALVSLFNFRQHLMPRLSKSRLNLGPWLHKDEACGDEEVCFSIAFGMFWCFLRRLEVLWREELRAVWTGPKWKSGFLQRLGSSWLQGLVVWVDGEQPTGVTFGALVCISLSKKNSKTRHLWNSAIKRLGEVFSFRYSTKWVQKSASPLLEARLASPLHFWLRATVLQRVLLRRGRADRPLIRGKRKLQRAGEGS